MTTMRQIGSECVRSRVRDLFLRGGFFAALSFLLASAQGEVVISEFMASNEDTLLLADGSSPDWIEIHNSGAVAVSLSGWHLTDAADELTRWTFPDGAEVEAGGYLLVYATGLDLTDPTGELHTDFLLSANGEYLALVGPDGIVEQDFAPTFPEQFEDVSYGVIGGEVGYFTTPTPLAENSEAFTGFVGDTTFSVDRGFYEEAFELQVTTATPGASIYFTFDGSDPDLSSARVDAVDADSLPVLSLTISDTTVVRAFAGKAGFVSSNIDTQSYFFLDEVIGRPEMSTTITGHGVWGPQMRDALLEIPSISLTTQEAIPNDDPSVESPREIPVSIEMIFPDGRRGFQVNAGVERFGGRFTLFEKQGLRVSFKKEYGPPRLNFDLFSDTEFGGDSATTSFNQILLRSGSQDSLFKEVFARPRVGAYIRNRYYLDRQLEMGQPSLRGKFVHVYLNGVYNGHYHLMERPTADFMATYNGEEEEDYDVMRGRSGISASEGNQAAWNVMVAGADDLATVEEYMDMDSYIDYMLLNFYGGNDRDWYPIHNWVAARHRVEGGQFQFFMWDNDFLNLLTSTANSVNNGGPGNMLDDLATISDFRMRMADRAQEYFFNGGMLTEERVEADLQEMGDRVARTIIPETARWGTTLNALPYTPDTYDAAVDFLVNGFSAGRSETVIQQMRDEGLFPEVSAPGLSQYGGDIAAGTAVEISFPEGFLFYTIDGSDPRLPGGGTSPSVIVRTQSPATDLLINETTQVKARVFSGGEFSALIDETFVTEEAASSSNLVISELHYNPSGEQGDDSEFIELLNISNSSVSLAGVSFAEGISYAFSDEDVLGAGESLVLVFDKAAFEVAYGLEIEVGGIYTSRLSNGGERVTLIAQDGSLIDTVRYDDEGPWSREADGSGFSLVRVLSTVGSDLPSEESWRSSIGLGGTPGDTDGFEYTGSSNEELLAYALGDAEPLKVEVINGVATAEFGKVAGADDALVVLQFSPDLSPGSWTSQGVTLTSQSVVDGDEIRMQWGLPVAGELYLRLLVTAP